MRQTDFHHIAINQTNGKAFIYFRKQINPVDKLFFWGALTALTYIFYGWFPSLSESFVFDTGYIIFTFCLYVFFFALFGIRIFFQKRRWIEIDKHQIVFYSISWFRKHEQRFDKSYILQLTHSRLGKSDNGFLPYLFKSIANLGFSIIISFDYREVHYMYNYILTTEEADKIIQLMKGNN